MSELSMTLPARYFINVTTSDTERLKDSDNVVIEARGIKLGTAGDLAIKDVKNNTVIITDLAVGVIHPIATYQILSTGTTATRITVFY